GATSATFDIATGNPTSITQTVISATLGAATQSSLFTVRPREFTISASLSSLVGGSTQVETITATLTNPAPAGGTAIALTSSDASATPPSQILVPAGQLTNSVTIP